MQVKSINQLLKQIYFNIEGKELRGKLQQVEQEDVPQISNITENHILQDAKISANVIASILGIELTPENLQYMQRYGFSPGHSLQRLIEYIRDHEDIKDLLMTPKEAIELLSGFDQKKLSNLALKINMLLATARQQNGKYVTIATRIINSQEKIQQILEPIIKILIEFDMDITSENVEFVDKFMFVFKDAALDVMRLLASSPDWNSTKSLKGLMEDPGIFLDSCNFIHNYEQLIDTIHMPDSRSRLNLFIEQVQRYIQLFPVETWDNIISLIKEKLLQETDLRKDLLDFFRPYIESIQDRKVKTTLYTRIESDIRETLQLQTKDDFPFWLVPIFSHMGNVPIFGELWVKKESAHQKNKDVPYILSLQADLESLGKIEALIYGKAKNISVYILCIPKTKAILLNHKESITAIFEKYDFFIDKLYISDQKSRKTIFSYIISSSTGMDREFDIKI